MFHREKQVPSSKPRSEPRSSEAPAVGILLCASVLLQLPFLDRGISFYDEGSILAIADQLRQGETLYRDRVTNLGPLVYEGMAQLFRIFGPHLWVGRVLQLLVFSGCLLLCWRILRDLVPRRWALIGSGALLALKPLAFPFWTEINYAQVGLLFALGALAATQRYQRTHRLGWLAVAGVAVGLTALTKQNLAAIAGSAVALALGVEAWVRRVSLPAFAGRGGVVFLGTALPLATTLALFAGRGNLDALLTRAVLGLSEHVVPYLLPFPDLRFWAFDSGDRLGPLLFAYFPAPIVHAHWQHTLGFGSRFWLLLVELFVKTIYYLPLLALLAGMAVWVHSLASKQNREETSRWTGLLVLALLSYGTQYRADWMHLMSIYPPLWLLGVVLLERWSRCSTSARRVGIVLLVGWSASALWLGAITAAIYRTPLDTPRGRLRVPRAQAEHARRVLDYLETRPESERIAFLRADPLFYFLAGRPIPVSHDLIMPGLLIGRDDRQLADAFSRVDRVIYNTSAYVTLTASIPSYAPLLSQRLSEQFRIVQRLDPSTLVLEPTSPAETEPETLFDLWQQFDRLRPKTGDETLLLPAPDGRKTTFERTYWLTYRVISAKAEKGPSLDCFAFPYRPDGTSMIRAWPMFPPEPRETRGGSLSRVRFTITLRNAGGNSKLIYTGERTATDPLERVEVALPNTHEYEMEIVFCSRLLSAPGNQTRSLRIGWGNPSVVRRPESTTPATHP